MPLSTFKRLQSSPLPGQVSVNTATWISHITLMVVTVLSIFSSKDLKLCEFLLEDELMTKILTKMPLKSN